jgi:uncharacterized delta-60 repeat protein
MLALIGCGALLGHAQLVLDDFNPNADGVVRVITTQPDGKVLVGGLFTSMAPNGGPVVSRNCIARLNADGTVDPTFNPNANSDVFAIAIQPDGKILVGGYFTSIGGQFRNRIARLDPNTGLADSFNPGASDVVRSIVLQTNGMILAGGDFSNLGGTLRNRIGRLDGNGVVDSSFNPNASFSSSISAIAIQPDGRILTGGTFTNIGGQARNRMARLDPVTGLADSFDPNADNDVFSIAIQPDGRIVAGGFFNNIGGQPRNYIARLNAATGLADSFNPNGNTTVQTVALQADGKILAGGGFTSIGGQPRGRLARLDAVTGQADSFNPNAGGAVSTIHIQADGRILAGGIFTSMSTEPRGRVARFSNPRPVLHIGRGSLTNVVITWPTNTSGYTLEASTNLSRTNWSSVLPAPAVTGTNHVVTNGVNQPMRFYRLRM